MSSSDPTTSPVYQQLQPSLERVLTPQQQAILDLYMQRPSTIAHLSLGQWFSNAHMATESADHHPTMASRFHILQGIVNVRNALRVIHDLDWDELDQAPLVQYNKTNQDF